MEFHVSLVGRRRLAEQIYLRIRSGIQEGQLRPADPLPSSRELADRLTVSRNTVTAAYDRLGAEGLIDARPGVGAFVSVRATRPGPAVGPEAAAGPRPQPLWASLQAPEDLSQTVADFDLRSGIPSRAHFPYSAWRSLVSGQLRQSAASGGIYGEPAGSRALRAAIARHVAVSRGVRARAGEVFVTNGFQQALDLIARVLLAPGDVVAVEDPGYPPPTMLFRSLRMRVVGIPVDAEGLVVSAIPDGTRLVYVTPSHQYPLGMAMSLARRRQLLAWAERHDAVIVEDDYDSEFRYAGRPLEPVQSIDESWRVLYVGSFSKTMLPTLRLGFLVAPPALIPALRKAKLVTDWHSATPMQEALAQFIDQGRFAAHIRRMRRLYEGRHERIRSILQDQFDDVLELVPSTAGLHVAALLRPGAGVTDRELVRSARRRGVELHLPVSALAVTQAPRQGLLVGYGAIATEDVDRALRRLRDCFDEALICGAFRPALSTS